MKILSFRVDPSIALIFSVAWLTSSALAQVPATEPSLPQQADAISVEDGDEDAGNARLMEKLKIIVIPEIDFDHVSLDDSLNYLRLRAAELDTTTDNPEEAGVEIIVKPSPERMLRFEEPSVRSLKLKNATLENALQLICKSVGYRCSIRRSALILEPEVPAVASVPAPAKSTSVEDAPRQADSGSSELSKTLSPLHSPDLPSARMVMADLQQLADSKNGAEKVSLLQIATVIRNVFSADFLVASKITGLGKAEADARQQEKIAADWRKPNAFGTINVDAAKDAMTRASQIRKKARTELADAREKLIHELRNADAIILVHYNKNDLNVVTILATTMLAINARSLPEGAYSPMFSQSRIADLNRFAQSRQICMAEALSAEQAGHFEKAIRHYNKARDKESRNGCANRFAALLEERGLFGSALEYYEMAGNIEKAAMIRQYHPDLLPDQFKVLTSDELDAKISPCCVRVSRDEEQGLGFLIKSGGYVITSRQLVDQSQKLQVTAEDGNSLPAKVIATSEEDDLALIQITLADHPVVAFRTQEVKNGLAVSSMGYAAPDSSSTSMMLASVARNDLPFRNRIVYVLAMTAQHCGGGPVVDQTGRLVGMLSVVKGETDLENQVLAIPSGIIAAFVQKHIR